MASVPPDLPSSLSGVFLQRANPDVRQLALGDAGLETTLHQVVTHAKQAHPNVELDCFDFVGSLAAAAAPAPTLHESLAAVHTADLWLARACVRADMRAVRKATALLEDEVARAGPRLRAPPHLQQEVAQSLAATLLVGDDGLPGIARYSGRGSIVGFLRVAVLRNLLRQKSQQKMSTPLPPDDLIATVTGLHDPEIEIIKARYRGDFNDAFRTGLQALTKRQRSLLRLHLVGGLSVAAIATSYRVHRSTVARWLLDARTTLLEETQRVLVSKLSLSITEVQSLTRLLHSQLDPSVTSILGGGVR